MGQWLGQIVNYSSLLKQGRDFLSTEMLIIPKNNGSYILETVGNPSSEGQNHGYKKILCTCLAWFLLFVAISVQTLYQKLKLGRKEH